MDPSNLYPLIERIGNLLRTETRKAGATFGLQPVHLQALHYLSQCNRYSDTPAAVTDYLGATKGTVSQSLLVLEKKGFVEKRTDTRDRRVQHLAVTEAGSRALAEAVPPSVFLDAASQLSETERENADRILARLLTELQRANHAKTFGVCKSCRYFRSEDAAHRCGLTGEALSHSDSEKICREHEPPTHSEAA